MSTNQSILLVSADLFFSTPVNNAISQAGGESALAMSVPAACEKLKEESFRAVLIDLSIPQLDLTALVNATESNDKPRPTFVAFGPHVQTKLLAQAEEAGCDVVLSRGQFMKSLPQLCSQLLSSDSA